MSDQKQNNRERVGGLWLKTNQYGDFFSGKLNLKELVAKFGTTNEALQIVIYAAKEQKTENSPTHNLFAMADRPAGTTNKPSGKSAPQTKPNPKPASKPNKNTAPQVDPDVAMESDDIDGF